MSTNEREEFDAQLRSGARYIRAEKEGYYAATVGAVKLHLPIPSETLPQPIQLISTSRVVRGRIVDALGNGHPATRLGFATDSRIHMRMLKTDEAGYFVLEGAPRNRDIRLYFDGRTFFKTDEGSRFVVIPPDQDDIEVLVDLLPWLHLEISDAKTLEPIDDCVIKTCVLEAAPEKAKPRRWPESDFRGNELRSFRRSPGSFRIPHGNEHRDRLRQARKHKRPVGRLSYELTVTKPGYRDWIQHIASDASTPVGPIFVALECEGRVQGTVFDPSGAPLSTAKVTLLGPPKSNRQDYDHAHGVFVQSFLGEKLASDITNDSGHYRIPVSEGLDSARLIVEAPKIAPQVFGPFPMASNEGRHDRDLRLTLGGHIVGSVRDVLGETYMGEKVLAIDTDGLVHTARSGEEGVFRLGPLPAQTYRLTLAQPLISRVFATHSSARDPNAQRRARSADIQVSPGQTHRRDLVIGSPESRAAIGTVEGGSGALTVYAECLGSESKGAESKGSVQIVPVEGGRFRLGELSPDVWEISVVSKPEGSYANIVLGQRVIDFKESVVPIRFRLEGADVQIQVDDRRVDPSRDLRVRWTSIHPRPEIEIEMKIDTFGRTYLPFVPAGQYVLDAATYFFAASKPSVHAVTVDVLPGKRANAMITVRDD